MKEFLLDKNPKFDSESLTLAGTTYKLTRMNGNGCNLTITDHNGAEDSLTLTVTDMRALFMLLCTEK